MNKKPSCKWCEEAEKMQHEKCGCGMKKVKPKMKMPCKDFVCKEKMPKEMKCKEMMPKDMECMEEMEEMECMPPSDICESMVLAHSYVPWQEYTQAYRPEEALMKGTLFPELWGVYPIPE